jgi:hypothetical protein
MKKRFHLVSQFKDKIHFISNCGIPNNAVYNNSAAFNVDVKESDQSYKHQIGKLDE